MEGWEPPQGATSACVCAAVARLADCAADPQASAHINVSQTLMLVDKLLGRGIYVLFLSTNQVFDGRVPQVPPDAPHSPVSEYGRQKARTESALCEYMARGAPIGILRLAKVVSPHMALLQRWIADLAKGVPISAFTDMTLAPTRIDFRHQRDSSLLSERPSRNFSAYRPSRRQLCRRRTLSSGKVGCRIFTRASGKRTRCGSSRWRNAASHHARFQRVAQSFRYRGDGRLAGHRERDGSRNRQKPNDAKCRMS